MKYNLADKAELDAALAYLAKLSGQEAIVEIKKVVKGRSLRQNAYIHLTFQIFALESGYDASESKAIYKRYANPDLYVYKKNGMPFLKSSADLTTEEMTRSIEKWRMYAGEHGIEIPLPTDTEAMKFWENRIEQEHNYL